MSFTCPVCKKTSGHPRDAVEGYCGHCHDWTASAERVACPACGGARCEQCEGHGWVWCVPNGPPMAGTITRCLDCGVIYVGVPTCGGAFEILAP